MEILSSHLFPCLLVGKTMWLETVLECRSRIVACPEKMRKLSGKPLERKVEDGGFDLVPLDAVDALAVQVEAAVEDCRLTRLIKGENSALTSLFCVLVLKSFTDPFPQCSDFKTNLRNLQSNYLQDGKRDCICVICSIQSKKDACL